MKVYEILRYAQDDNEKETYCESGQGFAALLAMTGFFRFSYFFREKGGAEHIYLKVFIPL